MTEETIQTAARRLVKFVRIDDNKEGGLLSIETIKAAETLDRQLSRELSFTRRSKVVDVFEQAGKWFIRFDESSEAVEFAEAKPNLSIGDKVDIIIRKV